MRKRTTITLEVKRKIIEQREQGVSVSTLSRMYNRSTSTICTILKNKDRIKEIYFAKGVTRISPQRLRILEDVEKLLLIWITEKEKLGDNIDRNIICEKAKDIFNDIVNRMPTLPTDEERSFKASRGWFENFKKRAKILGLEVDNNDTNELVNEEQITEFPLHSDLQQEVIEESLSEEEDVTEEQQPSETLRKMLKAWKTVASYVEKHHPDKETAMPTINLFHDNVITHFQQILKRRQEKMSLDKQRVKFS